MAYQSTLAEVEIARAPCLINSAEGFYGQALPIMTSLVSLVVGILARLAKVVGRVPVFNSWLSDLGVRYLNPVVTKLITNVDDPDLDSALSLYERSIPKHLQVEKDEIVRWLREDIANRKRFPGGPTDWFVVAKFGKRVIGFTLFHYYPKHGLALFAYMAISSCPGVPMNAAANRITAAVKSLLDKRRELSGLKGIVLEVEDPRRASGKRSQEECLARIRRFCHLSEVRGHSMRAFDIEYRQPRLVVDAADDESPLLLLSARTRAASVSAEPEREEVEEILRFIYTVVYPESCSTDPQEVEEYRAYCRQVCDKEIGALPKKIRALTAGQIASQVRLSSKRRSIEEV